MVKEKNYNSQLDKYCKLENNERIFIIDEKIFQKDSCYRTSLWGVKNKNRQLRFMLMKWEKQIQNYRHLLKRDITIEEIISLDKAMESYQNIMGCLARGWSKGSVQIEKIDILETLISDTDNSLFQDIEYKKKGYIRENIPIHLLYNKHVVTVIECEEYLAIKEIYIPYSGIVIQLPTE
jgi:hypothetical protein